MSRFPVILNRFPPSSDNETLDAWVEAIENFYKTNDKQFAWIQDLSHIQDARPEQRRRVHEHVRRMSGHLRLHCAGIAYLVTGTMARGMLTAVYWMSPPPHPHKICTTIEQCEAWVEAQLAQRKR